MSQRIDILKKPRLTALSRIEGLSIDQLNTIPAGFNNNIVWNLGHMVAAQYGITYKRAGLNLPFDESFFDTYKSGTKPERLYTADDLELIKGLLFTSLDLLETELQTDKFANYPAWTTRYGADLHSIDDAVAFLPFHDGLHIGTVVAIAKLVG